MSLSPPQTLVQPIIQLAQSDPDRTTLIFLGEDGSEEKVTAARFHAHATAFAQALQDIGVDSQDLVILVLRHSQVLLSAFWGALYLGAIPSIFPFLTEKLDPDLYMQRVQSLVAYSGARVVITFPEFRDALRALLAGTDCQVLSTDEVPAADPDKAAEFQFAEIRPGQTAFLQHSSGTTGLQKGVALSHRAVLNQIAAYSRAIQLNADDVIVSWLPLYHDMGLIAGFVMPIVAAVPLVLMSPFHWVRDSKILFQAMSAHAGTLSWLPNFAFNHLARTLRPADLEGMDLSSWRAVINCSEPVYHQSHQQFLKKFTAYGFSANALAVSYAMAENTFAVTQTAVGQPPRVDWVALAPLQERRRAIPAEAESQAAVAMVSCGSPIEGTEIAIVDENGATLLEREVGEVILQGNCMLTGYYRRPDLTAAAIKNGWYYTGDMGYLADGHLYISGRKKDLIIVGGKNVYPQDLEAIANELSGIHPGRAVAFGLYDERIGSETVVMVCELQKAVTERERPNIERQLRQEIVRRTEIALSDLRLVQGRWLIKTSSGKIARADNRAKYLAEFRAK